VDSRIGGLLYLLFRFHGLIFYTYATSDGGTLLVAQLVEALRYKPEGRGFDSRRCHWNFFIDNPSGRTDPGFDTASNRNEYQEYFLGVKAAGA
jgi:hypothetical protein